MGVTLKDWYDKDQVFDHDTFFVRDENGEIVQFSKGTGEPTLETLEVTENGTYVPSEGVDGFSSVKVNVEGAVGGSLPVGVYFSGSTIKNMHIINPQQWINYKGELIALVGQSRDSSSINSIWKYDGSKFISIYASDSILGDLVAGNVYYVEYNGKLHMYTNMGITHCVWDGNTFTVLNNFPEYAVLGQMFVQNGLLKILTYKYKVAVWDEVSDTWSYETDKLEGYIKNSSFYTIGETTYAIDYTNIYKYENGTFNSLFAHDMKFGGNSCYTCIYGGKLYIVNTMTVKLYCFDPQDNTLKELGYSNFYNMFVYDGKLHVMYSKIPHVGALVLHEVTE